MFGCTCTAGVFDVCVYMVYASGGELDFAYAMGVHLSLVPLRLVMVSL